MAIGRALRIGWGWIRDETRALDPSCFGLVMATGIVSNALLTEDQTGLPDALFAIGVFAYPWLWLLMLARGVSFGRADFHDSADR